MQDCAGKEVQESEGEDEDEKVDDISNQTVIQRKTCNTAKKLECETEYVESCKDMKNGYKGFTRKCEGTPIRKCHQVRRRKIWSVISFLFYNYQGA